MSEVKRLGIFGGSFDPVHLGHLLVACAAREEMGLDQVIFVPAKRSPFKQSVEPASDKLRLRMLRLALAGRWWCEVNDAELRRSGVSYTIDTVRALKHACGDAHLFLLIGQDHLAALPEWREVESLCKLVEFVVVPRPGDASHAEPMAGIRLHRLNGWPIRVSSSQIRGRVRARLPVDHLLPVGVADVIRDNGLYLD
jgi:nicotinate-nucleotide adenylyltransferase